MRSKRLGKHTRRSFAGIPEDAVPLFPTIPGDSSLQGGIPFLFDAFTNEPYGSDLFDWMDEGKIDAPVMGIFGNRNQGKTATTIAMAYRSGTRDVDGCPLKVSVDNHRGRKGIPEWQRFAQMTRTDIRKLRKVRMNLLDMKLGFTYGQQLQVVRNKIQLSNQRPLNHRHAEALKYGLMKVRDLFPEKAELGLLILCLRTMKDSEIRLLNQLYNIQLDQRHKSDPAYQMLLQSGADALHFTEGLIQACWELAGMLSEMMDGMFGELFGGDHSIAEDFAKQYYIKDYAGMSDIEIALVQSLYWEIKTAAVVNDMPGLLHDLEIHDENHKLWRYIEYAKPMHAWLKTIRDTSTAVVLASHRFEDYRTVGSESDETYKLANSMLNEISVYLLGQHTISSSYETAQRLGLNETERKSLLKMPKGTWGLKFANNDDPMQIVKVVLTKPELVMAESNQANKRKSKRTLISASMEGGSHG